MNTKISYDKAFQIPIFFPEHTPNVTTAGKTVTGYSDLN